MVQIHKYMTQLKTINHLAPSNNRRWNRKDDQILRQMVKEKATTSEVALALGRTKASVWGRKSSLGLGGRLASSKGKPGISAPTTLGTKTRTQTSAKIQEKPVETKKSQIPSGMENLDLATISQLAKRSGAKIVITFE